MVIEIGNNQIVNWIGDNMITQEYLDVLAEEMKSNYINTMNKDNLGNYNVTFDINKKYIRIVTNSYNTRSCGGFIVKEEGKFPVGTLLKSAGWAAPATNFGRGNIFNVADIKKVKWTGIS